MKDISTILSTKKTILDARRGNNNDKDDNIQVPNNKDLSFTIHSQQQTTVDTAIQNNPTMIDDSDSSKDSSFDLPMKAKRLTHEEEMHLGEIIQRGAYVHRIKTEFEQREGRDITKTEWVQLAQLKSPKELRRLVSDYRLAKNTLVISNMGLVHGIVRHRLGPSSFHHQKASTSSTDSPMISTSSSSTSTSTSRNEYDELLQEGSLGLLRASELFDPSRGLRFSTYATIWIKGVLSNARWSNKPTASL